MSEHANRRLAAIVAADVAGYSRLVGADEEGTLQALRGHRTDLIDPLLADHAGRIANTAGDSLLIEFPSAVAAVRFAIAMQEGMAARNETVPAEQRIEFRIGINVGDVVTEGDDLLGHGVNVAARLEALAPPGGICLSRTARDQVRDQLTLKMEDMGEVAVKNIDRPVRVFRLLGDGETPARGTPRRAGRPWLVAAAAVLLILVGGGGFYWWSGRPDIAPADPAKLAFPLPDKPSIAVLAFENLSGDPKQDYVSDGLSEDIIAALSRLPSLFVIARNSSFIYKGKPVKVQQVAEELGVRYLLEGSVQRSGEKLRVSAQLIDALSGHHLWSETYDRVVTELFAVKDDITLNIVSSLQVELTEGKRAELSRHDTNNLQAWLLYQEGQGHHFRFTKEDTATAQDIYRQVLELDPGYVSVYVSLAWTHINNARFKWSATPERSFQRGVELAEKALGLDPDSSHVHNLLNGVHLYRGEHDLAIEAGRKALALDPNNYDAAATLALALLKAMQPDQSIAHFKLAMRLSPYYPSWILENLGEAYVMAEQCGDAIDTYQKVLTRKPGASIAGESYLGLALCYDAQGREGEAREAIAKAVETYPRYTVSHLRGWLLYKDPVYLERYLATVSRLGLPAD